MPTLFEHPLPARENSKEPEAKRARLEDISLNGRAASNLYDSLDDIVTDIRLAAKLFKEERKLVSTDSKAHLQSLSPSELGLLSRVDQVVAKAVDLVQRQKVYDDIIAGKPVKSEVDVKPIVNGNHSAITKTQTPKDEPLALSLLGPHNKFMYTNAQGVMSGAADSVSSVIPKTALPNGITTIHAIQSPTPEENKKPVPTLGDLFAVGGSLPFIPLKPLRPLSAKHVTNGWIHQNQPYNYDNIRPRNSSQSYHNQQISVGYPLEYRGATKETDPKRKQRDRALSLSGVKATISSAEAEEQEEQELNALFRSVYSTFAPTRDDAAAIVPERVRSRLWWQDSGYSTFEKLVKNVGDMALDGQSKKLIMPAVDYASEFKQAVDSWPDVIDPSLSAGAPPASSEKAADEKDVDELLEEISELLETVSSYQRNRNSSWSAVSRPTATSLGGAPTVSDPGAEEIDMYNILRNQLTVMISMLPPYAVAKLNSDQLSELAISTKLPVEVESFEGTMEEEEHAKLVRLAAAPAAAAPRATPAPVHHRSGSSAHYGNQFNTAPRPTGTAQNYYNNTPVRAPAPIRPPQTAGPIPYGGAARGAMPIQQPSYRPQQYGTPTPAHQAPRPVQQQYPQNAAGYYNTPAASSRFPPNGMPSSVQQPVRYQQNPSTPNFQQRPLPQTNGAGYVPFNSNPPPSAQRQPSPQKSMPSAPLAGPYTTHAPSVQQPPRNFGTSTPAAQGYYGNSTQSMGMSAGVPMPPSMQQQIANGGTNLPTPMSTTPILPPGTNTNSNANISSVAANSNASPMISSGLGANGVAASGAGAGAGSGATGESAGLNPADSVLLGYRTTMSPAEQAAAQERARAQAQQHLRMQQNGMGVAGLQGQSQSPLAQGQGGMNGN